MNCFFDVRHQNMEEASGLQSALPWTSSPPTDRMTQPRDDTASKLVTALLTVILTSIACL